MAEILRIPDGNAFKLRITGELLVENYRSAADMSVVSRLIVNFVRRGRLPQVASVDDQGRIVALNLGLLPRGTYGVELTGYYNGEPWRFFQQDVFTIVDENSELSESTGGDVPIYDTTFTVSFRGDSITAAFVDAALNAHNNDEDAHPHLQQAIEDLQEQVGEAGTITDVLVDGESVVEGKVAMISTEGLRGSITDLQNQINAIVADKATVSLTASPSVVFIGEQKAITLTAKSSPVATSTVIKKGNTEIQTGTTGTVTGSDTITPSGDVSYQAEFVIAGITRTANATVSAVHPIYVGAGATAAAATTKQSAKTSPAGTYNIPVATSGSYVWFLVPNTMSISSAKKNGFNLQLEAPTTTTKDGVTYKVYRSSNTYDAGTETIVIS